MLANGATVTGMIYLVDWDSAANRADMATAYNQLFEGIAHYSAAKESAVQVQMIWYLRFKSAFVCVNLQAQSQTISKPQVRQISAWWPHIAWEQVCCWREAVVVARQNNHEEVGLRPPDRLQQSAAVIICMIQLGQNMAVHGDWLGEHGKFDSKMLT